MTGLNNIPKVVHAVGMFKSEMTLQSSLLMVSHIAHDCSWPMLSWDQVNALSVFLIENQRHSLGDDHSLKCIASCWAGMASTAYCHALCYSQCPHTTSTVFSLSSDRAYSEPLNASVTARADLRLRILWFGRFLYFWEVWKATKAKGMA